MPNLAGRLEVALTGRYAIERELGHGGTALVFLGRDPKHERPVAIKVLRPELAVALGAERFLREIKLTARLNHPHILPLLDSGEAAGFLYYVMPYVEGESLRDRLVREPQLPVEEALIIAREVADALEYAEALALLHRACDEHDPFLIFTLYGYPTTARLREDHRFAEIRERMGLPSTPTAR